MNNEELKKKIVEIIINAIWKDAEADYDSTDETEACSIADALIAAGIRDMSEIRSLADNVMLSVIAHKAEVSSMEQRAKEAEAEANRYEMLYKMQSRDMALAERKAYESEHRAAVAERALKRFSENIVCEDCPFFQECTLSSKLKAVSYSQKCFGEYLRQAEKEFAEEK